MTEHLRAGMEDGSLNPYPYPSCDLTARPLEGFDGSWYGTYEKSDMLFHVLLVRQGKNVALVTATVDLLEPEYLNSVRAALGF